jgi:hypothetical protein
LSASTRARRRECSATDPYSSRNSSRAEGGEAPKELQILADVCAADVDPVDHAGQITLDPQELAEVEVAVDDRARFGRRPRFRVGKQLIDEWRRLPQIGDCCECLPRSRYTDRHIGTSLRVNRELQELGRVQRRKKRASGRASRRRTSSTRPIGSSPGRYGAP